MVIKDNFSNLQNWEHDPGITVDDGRIVNTESSEQIAWQQLPESIALLSTWRITMRIKVNTQNFAAVHLGLADGPRLSFDNRVAFGVTQERFAQMALVTTNDYHGNTLEDGFYNISLVCDGETVTSCVSTDDHRTLSWTQRCRPFADDPPEYNHIYIRFFGNNLHGIDRIALRKGWGSFGDTNYEAPIKAVITTNEPDIGSRGDKGFRSFVETPINPDGTNKLVFLSGGFSGSWLDYIGSNSNYYTHVMLQRGYTTVSQDIDGSENGNWQSTTRALITRKKIYNMLNAHHKCFTVGLSMGALFACNMAIDYPDVVSRIILISGHSNLMWRYYSIHSDDTVSPATRKQSFWDAYDATEETIFHKTRGRNPHDNVDKLARYPLLARHSANETQVEAINAYALVDGINNAGGQAIYAPENSSSHTDILLYKPNEDADFFDLSTDVDLAKPPNVKHFLSGSLRVK